MSAVTWSVDKTSVITGEIVTGTANYVMQPGDLPDSVEHHWGDGSVDTTTITASSGSVVKTHSYASAGTYTTFARLWYLLGGLELASVDSSSITITVTAPAPALLLFPISGLTVVPPSVTSKEGGS